MNSCSRNDSLRNSHDNSNAVNIGSLEDSAINDGEASARYALIRLRECLKESSSLEVTHSSQLIMKIINTIYC